MFPDILQGPFVPVGKLWGVLGLWITFWKQGGQNQSYTLCKKISIWFLDLVGLWGDRFIALDLLASLGMSLCSWPWWEVAWVVSALLWRTLPFSAWREWTAGVSFLPLSIFLLLPHGGNRKLEPGQPLRGQGSVSAWPCCFHKRAIFATEVHCEDYGCLRAEPCKGRK